MNDESSLYIKVKDEGLYISQPTYRYKLILNDGVVINLLNQPNFIHRFFTKILLGWRYEKI